MKLKNMSGYVMDIERQSFHFWRRELYQRGKARMKYIMIVEIEDLIFEFVQHEIT
jgi:hypothetical protein